MTTGDKSKLFILFVPLFTLSLLSKIVCSSGLLSDHIIGALVRSRMNGLQPLESTIEQTTGTMPPSHKTTAAVMTTNRITSLRELLHHRHIKVIPQYCIAHPLRHNFAGA